MNQFGGNINGVTQNNNGEIKMLSVFDACGAMPNPSHIALIECMRPTTKPRRLISIATENESAVSSTPINGVASIAAAALSTWPSARSAGETDISVRQKAFAKLLKTHSYIARAASISVKQAVESTRENEKALEILISEKKRQRQEENNISASSQHQQKQQKSSSQNQKEEKNKDDKEEAHEAEEKPKVEMIHHDNNDDQENQGDTVVEEEEEEMKTLNRFGEDQNQLQQQSAIKKLAEASKFSSKNPSVTSSLSSVGSLSTMTTTAISYERIFPCTPEAPLISYDENSYRLLSAALENHVVKP
jgi:chemotaxis protein histidine kinase CheA